MMKRRQNSPQRAATATMGGTSRCREPGCRGSYPLCAGDHVSLKLLLWEQKTRRGGAGCTVCYQLLHHEFKYALLSFCPRCLHVQVASGLLEPIVPPKNVGSSISSTSSVKPYSSSSAVFPVRVAKSSPSRTAKYAFSRCGWKCQPVKT